MRRTALRWTWRAVVNVVYTLVVWYVLSEFRRRPENVILPVLGLIYVAVRTLGLNLAPFILMQTLALARIEAQVRATTEVGYHRENGDVEALEKMKTRETLK